MATTTVPGPVTTLTVPESSLKVVIPESRFRKYISRMRNSIVYAAIALTLTVITLILAIILFTVAYTRGVKTPAGPNGEEGIPGPAGPKGQDSQAGPIGPQGPAGANAYQAGDPPQNIPPFLIAETGLSAPIPYTANTQGTGWSEFVTQATLSLRYPLYSFSVSNNPPIVLLQVINTHPNVKACWSATLVSFLFASDDPATIQGLVINVERTDTYNGTSSPSPWGLSADDLTSPIPQIQYFVFVNYLPPPSSNWVCSPSFYSSSTRETGNNMGRLLKSNSVHEDPSLLQTTTVTEPEHQPSIFSTPFPSLHQEGGLVSASSSALSLISKSFYHLQQRFFSAPSL
jgi:hypothetical protein